MSLLYKPDWEETKSRFEAWWAHEYFGRCAIAVYAPKAAAPEGPYPAPPPDVEGRWLDHDYLSRINDYRMRRTFYGGEALPAWNPGYPFWASIPTYLGASITLKEDTGWIAPIMESGRLTDYDYRDFVVHPDSHWWKFALDMARFAASESRGRSVPAMIGVASCGDNLAAMRSTEQLLADLSECPEYVREFDQHIMSQWKALYQTIYDVIRPGSDGVACWMPLWSPGKYDALQNDFAYMISPKMFEEIFLPSIDSQTRYLDHAIHHVDGVGNFAHVDALCSLPRLQALQILPGDGKPSPLHYMDVLKKVQSAGKNLHITIPASEVREALANLSARGLFIVTYCESQQEAEDMIRCCEEWSVDR